MTDVSVLGLDVGGANLKAAHVNGGARCQPFALWKNPGGLAAALGTLLRDLPPFGQLAVTMTGELCDCFATKRQGVQAILDAVVAAAGPVPIHVWQTSGRFAGVDTVRADPLPAAAANWLALATYVGRLVPRGIGLLIDIGSTTTDLIPLLDGQPIPRGRTDLQRLACGELVYSGARRTPLCALLPGTAAELFATTIDAYLMLGWLPETPADTDTADGRPATVLCAHARLARMLCADSECFALSDALALARQVYHAQQRHVSLALQKVLAALPRFPEAIILAGSGAFLAHRILADCHPEVVKEGKVRSLADRLSPELSAAACAYAVAVLAAEGAHD